MKHHREPRAKYTATRTLALLALVGVCAVAAIPAKAATGATAVFVKSDTATKGSWKGVYGSAGYDIAQNTANSIPSFVTVTPEAQANWTWETNGTNPQDLQLPSTGRMASCWYSPSTFDIDLNFTDGNTHQVSVYVVDWDNRGRSETLQVVDGATKSVLDSRSVSNFANGSYFVWNVSGHVKILATTLSGPNAVISGVFFDAATVVKTTGATATFVNADTSTGGNWTGTYGADGSIISNAGTVIPSYASMSEQNQTNWTWTTSTTDSRALQNGSTRIASAWYSPNGFTIDVNVTDGSSHQVAIYTLDWDSKGRAQTIQVTDPSTQAVLDNRSVFSFTNGVYMIWQVSGHVRFTINLSSGPNAVVSGVFFGGGGSTAKTATAPAPPATTAALTTTPPVTTTITTPPVTTTPSSTTSSSTTGSSTTSTTQTTPPAQGTVSVSLASYNFGSVNVGSAATQLITVANTGKAAVTFSNVSVGGAGFNATGVSNGVMLNPGQSTSMTVTFTPGSAGAASGNVSLLSNASDASVVVGLSGTGAQAPLAHSVVLTWQASASSTIVGYDVYRSTVAAGPFALLNTSPVSSTNYTDSTGQQNQSYYYVVTSVSSDSSQSTYSNLVSATIP